MKRAIKKVAILTIISLFISSLSLTPVVLASSADAFKMMHISAIDNGGQKFINNIIYGLKSDNVDKMAIKAVDNNYLSMSVEDVKSALTTYLERKEDSKIIIQTIITFATKGVDSSKFDTIARRFNAGILNNDSDYRGFDFLISIFNTGLMAASAVGKSGVICTDDTSDKYKIRFSLPGVDSDSTGAMSKYVDLLDLTDTVSGYSGSNSYEKLLNYAENTVNNAPAEEVYNFKLFLKGMGLYSGSPEKRPAEPKPTTEGAIDIDNSTTNSAITTSGSITTNGPIITSGSSITNGSITTSSSTTSEASISSEITSALIQTGVVISDNDNYSDILKKMDKAVILADEYNKAQESKGLDTRVKSQIVMNVQAKADISGQLIEDAKNKAISRITINTSVASLSIPLDNISASPNDKFEIVATDNIDNLSEQQILAAGKSNIYTLSILRNGLNVTSFTKPLEISIPYTPKSGENTDKITVFWIDSNGNLVNMCGVYNAITKMVSFKTSHLSSFIVKQNVITFSDVSNKSDIGKGIESIAAKGIISGTPNGQFSPGGEITRAEFAKMIVKSFGIAPVKSNHKFKDVDDKKWYSEYVYAINSSGLMIGNGSYFYPDNKITRQEVATVLKRAMENCMNMDFTSLPNNINDLKGKDVISYSDKAEISSYAYSAVAVMKKYSLFSAISNKFLPKVNASRQEVAYALYKILK